MHCFPSKSFKVRPHWVFSHVGMHLCIGGVFAIPTGFSIQVHSYLCICWPVRTPVTLQTQEKVQCEHAAVLTSQITRLSRQTKLKYPLDFPTRFKGDPSDLSKTIEVLGKHWPIWTFLGFISLPERRPLMSAAKEDKLKQKLANQMGIQVGMKTYLRDP